MTRREINQAITILERLQQKAPIIVHGSEMSLLAMLIPELTVLASTKLAVLPAFESYQRDQQFVDDNSIDHVIMCRCGDRAEVECSKYCVNCITEAAV